MDSRRLTLTRPTSRPVAPRRAAAHVKEAASVINDHVTATVADTTPTQGSQPHFSKLTPIYQPSPVNTVAAISGPRVKGIEFIKTTHKSKKAAPLVSDTPMNTTLREESTKQLISHRLEELENNLDSVDLDLMGGVIDEEADLAEVFGAAIKPVEYQQVNYIEQYFERSAEDSVIKHHIKTILPKVAHSIKKVNKKHVRRIGVLSILTGVIAFGGYLVADSFFVNQEAKAILAQDTSTVASPVMNEATTSSSSTNAAATTSQSAASTPTPGNGVAAASTIPGDQPKYLTIKKLGIHAPVANVGLTSAGAVDTPKNIWDAAWYNGSAKPGNDGATLIDGHSSATRGALFGNLDRLAAGDQIQVTRGDGAVITYSVAYVAVVDRNHVDMASMLKPYGSAAKGLNIITCEGQWVNSEETLQNRVLVYAQQI